MDPESEIEIEQEYTAGFADKSRTSKGTDVGGKYGRMLGRNEDDLIIYNFSQVFDSGVFSQFKGVKPEDAIERFKKLPGFRVLNPTLAAAAIVFVLLGYELDKANFRSYKSNINQLKVNAVDLLRYIRYVK